jgi:hypothetical protein
MTAHGKIKIRPLMLRLPKSLHLLLRRRAKKADRSLNAEIVWRLGLSFDLEGELAEAKLRLAERDSAAAILERVEGYLGTRQAQNENISGQPSQPARTDDP